MMALHPQPLPLPVRRVLLLCALAATAASAAASSAAEDMELLRNRTLSALLPTAATIAPAVRAAKSAQSSMTANGSWPDIN
jgi:hypothetical protein